MLYNRMFKASSTCLLAFLFLIACNNTPEQTNTAPLENAQDTSAVDTSSSVSAPLQSEHTHVVEISKMKFNPDVLTIPKGDTVLWVNNDITNHCVTEDNKAWTSSVLAPGQSWKKAITKNTDYYCAIHLVMKGKIEVQ